MSDVITEYLDTIAEPTRTRIDEIYTRARTIVPEAVAGVSYGMPSLLYRGKGLLSVMSTRKHIGVYPFGNLGELAAEVNALGLETTKGSIHLREGEDLPVELLERFLLGRKAQIELRAG
ncbi:DUF1801 domain-containing protein [Subtercola sp. PAMC28395]|uniref:iron chaperone n=1 Tax=Subtercola sp. PAMC28395 TaxID=2846775 RepID=UPI001C0DC1BD|nr:DUF1801 domain-containing protein [Subtercola sp. PAMC28395]QWT22908.1 DUF1801 domain-containing protein [Subtercola sp. PAMC28395]